ncbi:MAG TPA: sulfotransferase, partial [Thermoanaerobaculia bacterium]|nr:sulfotransferase [Thermoanaerobaculia bacterium]
MTKTPSRPGFIVGVPRSGTSLLAAMLNAHSRISCGPETHFFVQLDERLRQTERLAANWPSVAVDLLLSLELEEASVCFDFYNLDRADLERELATRPPSVAAMLESLTATRAKRHDKAIWIEKTP